MSALKDQVDQYGQALFIKDQAPEAYIEKRKQISARLKILREENEKKPVNERSVIRVNNDNILVDDIVDTVEVNTLQPVDLFLNDAEQSEVDKIAARIQETDLKIVRNSHFIGHAIKVHSTQQVNRAYVALAQRYAAMDHIFMAYALKEEGRVKSGHCDDGEHGGGNSIKRILLRDKVKNTAIFIVRKFGGVHLGLDHFRTIEFLSQKAIKLVNPDYIPRSTQEIQKDAQLPRRGRSARRGQVRGRGTRGGGPPR